MKSIETALGEALSETQPASTTGSDITVVFASGCSSSGWDMIVPILQQSGLEAVNDRITEWYDEFFRAAGSGTAVPPARPLQIPAAMAERILRLLPAATDTPLLLADSRNLWLLDSWAGLLPGARFLLFYTRPQTALAEALYRTEQDPGEYLVYWQSATRLIIDFQRRHRDRSMIFDAETGLLAPHALFDICRHIGLDLAAKEQSVDTCPEQPVLEYLLADYIVSNDSNVLQLETELGARAQSLSDGLSSSGHGTEDIIRRYGQQASAERQLRRLLGEIQSQLHDITPPGNLLTGARMSTDDGSGRSVTDDVKRAERILSVTGMLGNEHRKQLAKTRESLQYLEIINNKLEKENESLLVQLQQAEQELSGYYRILQDNSGLSNTMHEPGNIQPSRQKARLKAGGKIPAFLLRLFPSLAKAGENREFRRQVALLRKSGMFDETWYLAKYPDVARENLDPVEHYLRYGASEFRDPSEKFDTRFYLAANKDVETSGINPLVHYLRFGKDEKRPPSP